MEKKQKILIVHNYYQIPGGEDTVVVNEKKMLELYGHEVVLYTRNNSELKHFSKLRKLFLSVTTIFNPKTYLDIKKLIKNAHIDIVHVHNTLHLISPSVYYAALKCKVPVVQTIHNFRLLCPGAIFYRDGHICEDCIEHGLRCAVKNKCYRNSKIQTLACVMSSKIHRALKIYSKLNYICLTEFNKRKLLQFKQIDPKKVYVKPNFMNVDEGKIIPGDQRKNQFVFAGRLDKLKGIDILFKAWQNIHDSELIVCGMGPMEKWCRDYIKENNIDNIKMLGFTEHKNVIKIIAESKALILPTQWYEGFPMTIIEAFSVATPVLCSALGNADSVVQNGVNGWKFENDSVESILASIEKIQRGRVLCDDIISLYKKYYTMSKNYMQYSEILSCCNIKW